MRLHLHRHRPPAHLQSLDELFESCDHSLPNTKDGNDPIILHESLVFTTCHVPRTLLTEKGAHRSRPASTSPSTWCARQRHSCVRKGRPRLERARPNLLRHSRARSALQDRRPLDHGMGACEGACLARAEDVAVITPYYNVGPKGETNHLKKYGIEYDRSIDVHAPDKYEIGLHYGVVNGSGSFLATPYPTGPTFYSSSSLRSPSSSSARSASALMLKRR